MSGDAGMVRGLEEDRECREVSTGERVESWGEDCAKCHGVFGDKRVAGRGQ